MALMALPSLTALQASRSQELDASKPSSGSSKRKKKKRKRRKLPKAPLPRSGAVLGQGRCAGVAQRQGCGQIVQNTVLVPQLHFIEGRLPPFVPQRQIPMVLPVQITIETPQLQSVRWSVPLLCRSCHARCRLTVAHGSDTAELRRCRSCSSSVFWTWSSTSLSWCRDSFPWSCSGRWCVCMLNGWFSSNDVICADNFIYFRFKLKGKGRREQWEVFLFGDKTIKVDRDSSEVLPRGMPPPRFFTLLGNGSHSIFELCLPSERGMGMSMPLAVPVSSGKYSGTCMSTAPAVYLPRCPSQSL